MTTTVWLGDQAAVAPFLDTFPFGSLCSVGVFDEKNKNSNAKHHFGYAAEDGNPTEFVAGLRACIETLHNHIISDAGITVLIHCHNGMSRSPLFLFCYLLVHGVSFQCLCKYYIKLKKLHDARIEALFDAVTNTIPPTVVNWYPKPVANMDPLCRLLYEYTTAPSHKCKFAPKRKALYFNGSETLVTDIKELKRLYTLKRSFNG